MTAPHKGAQAPHKGAQAGDPARGPRPRTVPGRTSAGEPLLPLADGERPAALSAAIAVSALLAVGVVAGALTVHDLKRHGGSLPGAVFLALVLSALGIGMYRRRYWAVLSFEALLAFQVIVTSLALVVASTVKAALICMVAVALGGLLFWKLVRVMGRIQAGQLPPGGDAA
jgi:hypothetical protein